jgi:hypothetical protein
MERLRNVTLAVSAVEILLWLVIAVLNDREDPQALGDVLSIMFVAMLPANLAFIMSLLRRGPAHGGCSCSAGVLDAVAAVDGPNCSTIVTNWQAFAGRCLDRQRCSGHKAESQPASDSIRPTTSHFVEPV